MIRDRVIYSLPNNLVGSTPIPHFPVRLPVLPSLSPTYPPLPLYYASIPNPSSLTQNGAAAGPVGRWKLSQRGLGRRAPAANHRWWVMSDDLLPC